MDTKTLIRSLVIAAAIALLALVAYTAISSQNVQQPIGTAVQENATDSANAPQPPAEPMPPQAEENAKSLDAIREGVPGEAPSMDVPPAE